MTDPVAGPGFSSRSPLSTPSGARVLVVEDDEFVRHALGLILRRAGFDPILTREPNEAYTRLDATVDALLIDFRLPNQRGDIFFYVASAHFPALRRRSLFMTGDITIEAEKLINATGCQCLWKPFQNTTLVDALRAFFEPRGSLTPAER